MNNLMKFENELFGEIRMVELNKKTYAVGNDVARILGYAIPSKAVNTHCKGVSKMEVPTSGGIQQMQIIPEGDIYRLIIKSQLPQAEKFERWVFDEVLPQIRRTGAYTQVSELKGQEKMFRLLEGKVENLVNEAVREMEEKCSQFYRPASKEKTNITSYIKKRLGIDKANEEYELVKQRVLIKLGAEKWEDVPVETLVNSLDIVDESIKVIKSDRVENQINFFGTVDEVACSRY